MKRSKSPYLNDSKTFQCITRFELIPPNMVAKDNPVFSAFSKTKYKKHFSNEQDSKNNKTEDFINDIKFNENHPSKKSLLLGRGQTHNNILEGVLRARKSQMKKLKLKQFYLEEYAQCSNSQIDIDNQNNQNIKSKELIESKNSTEFNTIESKQSKHILTASNNLPLTQKKKILPVKLRAKSYSSIPKNVKDHTFDMISDQNSLLIQPKKNKSFHLMQKNLPKNNQTMIENLYRINSKRAFRAQGRKKYQHLQNERSILGDISMKMNELPLSNVLTQKTEPLKCYQSLKDRKGLNRQYNSKAHESIFEINGWGNNHNQDDKQNQFFIF